MALPLGEPDPTTAQAVSIALSFGDGEKPLAVGQAPCDEHVALEDSAAAGRGEWLERVPALSNVEMTSKRQASWLP